MKLKFCEKPDTEFLNIPQDLICFVYFMISNGEVVYVGKTTKGMSRPFSHTDKEFDQISIIKTTPKGLAFTESEFIRKYTPKYNKSSGEMIVLQSVRNRVRETVGNDQISLSDIKNSILHLGISPAVINFSVVVSLDDLQKIIDYFKGEE